MVDIEADISAVEAAQLLEHSMRTWAVVSWVAAAENVEGGGGLGCSSHSALRSWHRERSDGVSFEHLPLAAPFRSSCGNVGG